MRPVGRSLPGRHRTGLPGAAFASAFVVGVPFGTAHATALELTCAGTVTTTFSPGLTLVPTDQALTVNEVDAPCVSASRPDITSGQSGVSFHEVFSCLDLAK